jgi:hypothetical protein
MVADVVLDHPYARMHRPLADNPGGQAESRNLGAEFGEQHRRRRADPGRAAGDENLVPGEQIAAETRPVRSGHERAFPPQ